MSDPLLEKMDALLKKHRQAETAAPSTPASTSPVDTAVPALPDNAWLPVLTDVVALGDVDATLTSACDAIPPAAAEPAVGGADPEELLSELEPRLSALIQGAVTNEIRNSLDNALASLLAQLDVHVREIVRNAVNEKLGK